jgi:hypothetical protein
VGHVPLGCAGQTNRETDGQTALHRPSRDETSSSDPTSLHALFQPHERNTLIKLGDLFSLCPWHPTSSPMREEPLPQIIRPRRQAPGGPPEPEGLGTGDEAADLMPDIDLVPNPHTYHPFMLDFGESYHLHLAALEFRRQLRLRQLAKLREKLVLAAVGLPLMAILLKLLWSILSGSRWWPGDIHLSPWQRFVGGDW